MRSMAGGFAMSSGPRIGRQRFSRVPGYRITLSFDDENVYAKGTVPIAVKLLEGKSGGFIRTDPGGKLLKPAGLPIMAQAVDRKPFCAIRTRAERPRDAPERTGTSICWLVSWFIRWWWANREMVSPP